MRSANGPSDAPCSTAVAAVEEFGCWYRSYSGATPSLYLGTDGAAFVDYTRRVAVGTSLAYASISATDPGRGQMFRVHPDLSMAVWLPQGAGNPAAGGTPISAICH